MRVAAGNLPNSSTILTNLRVIISRYLALLLIFWKYNVLKNFHRIFNFRVHTGVFFDYLPDVMPKEAFPVSFTGSGGLFLGKGGIDRPISSYEIKND